MWQRMSKVDYIDINILSYSSVVTLGDIQYLDSVRYTYAMHREKELFFGREGSVSNPKVFREVPEFEPLYEDIQMDFIHINPCLHVPSVKILAVSNNGFFQVGNGDSVYMENRTMNVRHLERDRRTNPTTKSQIDGNCEVGGAI